MYLKTELMELAGNTVLWSSVCAWFVAHTIKFVLEFIKFKRFSPMIYFRSGGMPSSHSAFVTAMATSIGIKEGFNSSHFAIGAVVSVIVMYDAAGVRQAAGKQAAVINMIVENIENAGIILDKKLKELLGHTPVEVAAGSVLGVIIGILCNLN